MRIKSCCCCLKLETGIYLIGGVDFFFFLMGIIGMVFIIFRDNEPEERSKLETSHARPEEFPGAFLSPFLFELPRLIAFFYLVCRNDNENNLQARKIYYFVQAFSMVMMTLIAIITIGITLAYVPKKQNYDERYCNARSRGSDTHEAWAYYEQHRGAKIRQNGHTALPEYASFMDYVHDNTTGSECARMLAEEEAFFFCVFLAIYLYFYFVTKSYYLQGVDGSAAEPESEPRYASNKKKDIELGERPAALRLEQ